MEKPRLGMHTFRKLATKAKPFPVNQACLVVGLNLDGTANVLAFEPNGEAFFFEKAQMAQAEGEVGCHYHEACSKAADEGDGGGEIPPSINLIEVVTFDPDSSSDSYLTHWQEIEIAVPNGSTLNHYTQGSQWLEYVDGPRSVPPGTSTPPPQKVLPTPRSLMVPITGGTLPWWWLATPRQTSDPLYKAPSGLGAQYYY